MLGRARCSFHKKRSWTRYAELVLLPLVGVVGHVVNAGASWPRNIDALFFMLRWDRYRFNKKHVGTRYAEIVFLHPVGYTGHVVNSGASRQQNIDALFFMLSWA
jgi:hypothetical protein